MCIRDSLHTLITALIHARQRIPAIEAQVAGDFHAVYCVDAEKAAANLVELAEAHEAKEVDGRHARYVWGCQAGTNRAGRRLARILGIFSALGYEDIQVSDDALGALLPG